MKVQLSRNREAAMTLFEVGVVIAIVAVLAVLLLPMLHQAQNRAVKIHCINHLMNISTAAKVWEDDHHGYFPMGVFITNGGSMQMVQTGDVVRTFLVMSNELSTPYILCCPGDVARSSATSFGGLTSSNISYFVGLDITNDINPQTMTFGDCNFELARVPVKSGLNAFWTNDPVAWQATRHVNSGNISLADGSVQSATSAGLQIYLHQTSFATNRFAIP
ncbi:MAG TPA: hypothetical protein VK742_06405 [Candidatus Sulfotelmatobacter sp.]|jgi:prepilin-type processing-associated H-X9-DG protein|nr:hypothetical protein [Candidatus Sulfotelmatobacter sp.]